jgi:hypothetical protein
MAIGVFAEIREGRRMVALKAAMQTVVLLAFLAGLFLLGKAYRAGGLSDMEETTPFNLGIEAERLNATLPEMVSAGVRLDETRAGPGNAFVYFYTILDGDRVKEVRDNQAGLNALTAQLRDRVCSMMPAFRDHGAVVTYLLRDSAGKAIADIRIDPMDC